MNIQEAIETYNALKDNILIEKYEKALDVLIKGMSKKSEKKYYKSDNENDYYIELPYERLTFVQEGAILQHRDYNCVYCKKGEDIDKVIGPGNFCLSLCKLTEEEVKQRIDDFINSRMNKGKSI